VFITGRRQEALDAALKQIGGRVTGGRGDMSNLADIDRLYDAVQQKHAQIDRQCWRRRVRPARRDH
jgi:NAD(P)-dependent dehydrogenase (short-subunit alcohol dehydrogenase family)